MVAQYDIFLGTFGHDVTWLEAVEELESAEARMTFLAVNLPGPYFVYSPKFHGVVASTDTTNLIEA